MRNLAARPRMIWLDSVKAIGMIAVAYGHVAGSLSSRYVYLWHMPLFFFLAGYVFRPQANLRKFAFEKGVRLLVPYAVFLVALSLPAAVELAPAGSTREWGLFVVARLAGGKLLYGWLVAAWFVTCLYLTMLLVNFGIARLKPKAIAASMVASLLIAFSLAHWAPRFFLPWNAHVCLFAAPIFYAGFYYRSIEHKITKAGRLVCAAFAVLGILGISTGQIAALNMKDGQYGTPVLAAFFGVCITLALISIAQRWLSDGRIARSFAFIGEASLVILFLHFAVQQLVAETLGIANTWVRVSAATAVPTLIYALSKRFSVTRAALLGSLTDIRLSISLVRAKWQAV